MPILKFISTKYLVFSKDHNNKILFGEGAAYYYCVGRTSNVTYQNNLQSSLIGTEVLIIKTACIVNFKCTFTYIIILKMSHSLLNIRYICYVVFLHKKKCENVGSAEKSVDLTILKSWLIRISHKHMRILATYICCTLEYGRTWLYANRIKFTASNHNLNYFFFIFLLSLNS